MKAAMFANVLDLDRKAVTDLKITDPYSIHRVVYSLFEDVRTEVEKLSGKASGIVYADQGGTISGRQILILSNRLPLTCVDDRYGQVKTKKINKSFLNYDRYRFKVVVNPCQRNNKTRKLVPVKGRDAVAQWFAQRSEKSWGFSAGNAHLQVDNIEVLQFKGKKQRPITIEKAGLQGVLHVADREKFTQSFQQGIGRGRAFGCGLLQIVPQPDNPFTS